MRYVTVERFIFFICNKSILLCPSHVVVSKQELIGGGGGGTKCTWSWWTLSKLLNKLWIAATLVRHSLCLACRLVSCIQCILLFYKCMYIRNFVTNNYFVKELVLAECIFFFVMVNLWSSPWNLWWCFRISVTVEFHNLKVCNVGVYCNSLCYKV